MEVEADAEAAEAAEAKTPRILVRSSAKLCNTSLPTPCRMSITAGVVVIGGATEGKLTLIAGEATDSRLTLVEGSITSAGTVGRGPIGSETLRAGT